MCILIMYIVSTLLTSPYSEYMNIPIVNHLEQHTLLYHILTCTQDMFNFANVINSKCNKSYLPGV